LDGHFIAFESVACDGVDAVGADEGGMAVWLAAVDVCDVDFYDGGGDEFDGVGYGDGGVGIGGGVEYDAVGGEAHGVELVDECAFAIGLEVRQM